MNLSVYRVGWLFLGLLRPGIHPISLARVYFVLWSIFDLQLQRMETRVQRLRTEAQEIIVRHIVGDGDQVLRERFCVFEGKVLATGKLRHGLRHIALEAIFCGEERNPRQPQWWKQITSTIQRLRGAIAMRIRVGLWIFAHTATPLVWFVRVRSSSRRRQL